MTSLTTKIIACTALFEAATLFFRYGLGMKSQRDTKWVGRLTCNVRIHHGYVGVLLFLLTRLLSVSNPLRAIANWLGPALFLSDFVHHFLVLWPIEGSPEFDFFYDQNKEQDGHE